MKDKIKIIIKGELSNTAIEDYYKRLWSLLDDEYGEIILEELFEKLQNGEKIRKML